LPARISGNPHSGAAEEVDIVAFLELHEGLLPVLPLARRAPEALDLAAHVAHLHCLDLDVEQVLHGGLDLFLCCGPVHREHHLPVLVGNVRGLLRDMGPQDDLHQSFSVHCSASSIFFMASAPPTTTFSWRSSATGFSSRQPITSTLTRLRAASSRLGCSPAVTNRTSSIPADFNNRCSWLVFGSGRSTDSTTRRRS